MNLRPYLPTGYHKHKQMKIYHKKQSSKIQLKEEITIKQNDRQKKQDERQKKQDDRKKKQDERQQIMSRKLKQRPSSKSQSYNNINLMSKQYLSGKKGPQQITATNFMLYDLQNKISIINRAEQQRQIASLTKIMTVIVAIQFINKHQLQKSLMVRVSTTASSLVGTSAKLTSGVFIKLYDLLYGAMLPSGNDAAYLLAQVLGLLMFYQKIKPQQKQYEDIQSIDLSYYDSTVTFINCFIKEMNRKAKQLKMTKTNFSNPHGLGNALNVSTAYDVMTLAKYAASNEQFNCIMSTKQYEYECYDQNMNSYGCKIWKNTNKLLELGWQGIKTGHTSSAGCCLASLKNNIFIVVLNSSTIQRRFEDTIEIYQWYQQQGKQIIKSKKQNCNKINNSKQLN